MEENRDLFDIIMSLPGLRILEPFYKRYKEQLLYLFVGGLTTFLNLFVFWLCIKVLPPLGANVIAWIAGVLFAYITNRKWVFKSKRNDIPREFFSFCAGRLATLGMEELILWVGIIIIGINAMIVKIIATVVVIVGNYVISKWIVFKQ